MSTPAVSVIIVNWNTRDMVLRLLASLSTPTVEHDSVHELELVVVDNNSSDGSVESIESEFPETKLIAQSENLGFAGGVNAGLKVATKPLVLLLNSDTKTSRASIEETAIYMSEFPEVGILGPQILSPKRQPQSSAWRDPSLAWVTLSAVGLSKLKFFNFERYHEKPFEEARAVGCVSGCAMMIRRELLDELGGLDEDYFMYFEEVDFCLRARQLGRSIHHAPVGEFVHEEGGSAKRARLRTFLDLRRSQILLYRKHGGVVSAIVVRGLLALGSALRILPLAAWALLPSSERARNQLKLHLRALVWLLSPFNGLVPSVDRSE